MQRKWIRISIITVGLCMLFIIMPFKYTPVKLKLTSLSRFVHFHHKNYIIMDCDDGRGLGNQLFNFASLLGIAKKNKMIPTLPETSPLRKYFQISARITAILKIL